MTRRVTAEIPSPAGPAPDGMRALVELIDERPSHVERPHGGFPAWHTGALIASEADPPQAHSGHVTVRAALERTAVIELQEGRRLVRLEELSVPADIKLRWHDARLYGRAVWSLERSAKGRRMVAANRTRQAPALTAGA